MIAEDYVSFEAAKLLKEKGFKEPCHACYPVIGKFIGVRQYLANSIISDTPRGTDFNWHDGAFISCPTLQMAIKWLREVHKKKHQHHIRFTKISKNRRKC